MFDCIPCALIGAGLMALASVKLPGADRSFLVCVRDVFIDLKNWIKK